jgi:predicted metal-dependent peptidase
MLTDLGFKGGGSTRMEMGFEWCKEKGINPDTVIILTDGYTPWPEDHAPAKRALWVITTPGVEAPEACGQTIYMPLDGRC